MTDISERNGAAPGGPTDEGSGSLADALRPIWTRRWAILILVIVVTGATYVFYASRPNEYTASTSLLLASDATQESIIGTSASAVSARDLQNQVDVLNSKPVADLATGLLRAPVGKVSAKAALDADIISLSATRRDPALAARTVNAYASAYLRTRSAESRKLLERSLADAQRALSRLSNSSSADAQRSVLTDRISNLRSLLLAPPGVARQLARATVPTTPSAPRPARNALFAFAIALIVGLFAAFGLDRFDRRLRRVDDIERAFNSNVLSALPHAKATNTTDHGEASVAPELREPLRGLRTNLKLSAIDREIKTLLVTSAVPGEGKSTVVRNLALTYAEWGLRVAVIEADLRRPTLAAIFGAKPRPGLTSVLVGESDMAESLREIEVHIEDREAIAQLGGSDQPASALGHVALLPAGDPAPNPQAVLESGRMQELLREAGRQFDIVLIDTPPLLAVSDTVPLLGGVDGVLIVARLDMTTRDNARRLTKLVGRVPRFNLLGVVANDLSTLDRSYGYGQYAAYTQRPSASSNGAR